MHIYKYISLYIQVYVYVFFIYIYIYIYVAAHQYFAQCIISAACDAQHTAHYICSSASKNKRSTSQKCMRSLIVPDAYWKISPHQTSQRQN